MSKFKLVGVALPLFCASCSLQTVKDTAANTTKNIKQFSISDLRSSDVNVVEVREKELKEMPLGKERAIAFEKEQKRKLWSFIKFEEPDLPVISDSPEDFDTFLLPPKEL